MGRRAIDLVGQKFGKLTVIKQVPSHGKSKSIYWLCHCDCGNENVEVRGSCLISGHTTSCGCYITERLVKVNTKHGGFGTRLYHIWQGMKKRCSDTEDKDYHNYGGRGIQICSMWRDDFGCFQEWALHSGYQDNLTIDRINNNGNYEPGNCRWATAKEQSNNKRNNRLITIANKTQTLSYWLEEQNISKDKYQWRIQNGWSELEALEFIPRLKKKERV